MRQYLRDYLFVLGEARSRLLWMVLLLLLSAALDVFGLGLIAPLIAAVTNAGRMFQGTPFAKLMLTEEGSVDRTALMMLAALVILAFAAKGLMAYTVQLSITRYSEMHRRDLMRRLLSSYLAKPYEFHLQRNSASLINTIISFSGTYSNGTLAGSMRLFADAIMLCAIVSFLAWTDMSAVVVLVVLLGTVFVIYNRIVKSRIQRVGVEIATASEQVVRSVTDSIGPLREVRILGVEKTFTQALDDHAARWARGSALGTALRTVPRYLIETAMVLFIVVLGVVSVMQGTSADTFVPTLGVFGVAALRLMPASTSIMSGINELRQSRYILSKLVEDLRGAVESDKSSGTQESVARSQAQSTFSEISFDNVSYTYPAAARPAVNGLAFTIKTGQAVGLIGRTGSGKSTTGDLLLGLLQPQSGKILVDGKDIRDNLGDWMRQLAYIPQSIFLTDDTLRHNIAFGVSDNQVNTDRLAKAVLASQLQEVIENLPVGLDTVVGERGVRLSGGQRQRVALARALYHNRELIVMDEATASLDHETEQEVVRAITTLHGDKTLFIIAHRLSTLEGCDLICEMVDGKIVRSGSSQEILASRGGQIRATSARM